ncbi:hypothetical protein HS5_15810 [Acidianus sp. HS-5]|nr:hypothetical protein HS5_15810 [Acidianus sp. HS-5]
MKLNGNTTENIVEIENPLNVTAPRNSIVEDIEFLSRGITKFKNKIAIKPVRNIVEKSESSLIAEGIGHV